MSILRLRNLLDFINLRIPLNFTDIRLLLTPIKNLNFLLNPIN